MSEKATGEAAAGPARPHGPKASSRPNEDLNGASDLGREISRGIVALYKRYMGRGPSFARTQVSDALIVTILSDTLTPAEKTLQGADRAHLVREQRRVFQEAFKPEAVAMIERITGRTVHAFLSDHAIDPDCAAEVFILDPDQV